MTRNPFEPLNEFAQWKLLLDFMRNCEGVVSFAELALSAEVQRDAVSGLIVKANEHLARNGEGARIVNVKGIGYRWGSVIDVRQEVTLTRQVRMRGQLRRTRQAARVWRNHPDATVDDIRMADEADAQIAAVQRASKTARATLRGFAPERVLRVSNNISGE